MSRIRSLHPDFFIDDDLCKLDFVDRLVFAGLWCYADREGRLEDKPNKLKVQILPYDNINLDECLNRLITVSNPFIIRYAVDSKDYIQIINWHKYQHPHHSERDSTIPPYDDKATKRPLVNGYIPVRYPPVKIHSKDSDSDKDIYIQHFEKCWSEYPRRLGKKQALTHYKASVKTDSDRADIEKAISNYKAVILKDKTEERYIKHGDTFFNNWRDYVSCGTLEQKKSWAEMTEEEQREHVLQKRGITI